MTGTFSLNFKITPLDVIRLSPGGKQKRANALGLLRDSAVGVYYFDPVYNTLVPLPVNARAGANEITAQAKNLGTFVLVEERQPVFTDIKGSESYAAAVKRLAAKNLISGHPDG
ncbi:S-layer homology domain-containing protein, partial [Peptococcaceae bacterium]|nr:S-layer homology domain-containing protein [Peptococcaceae bacterium]